MQLVPGIIFMGIGAGALVALKGNRAQRNEMLGWPTAPGVITDRALERRSGGGTKGGVVYTPAYRYTYTVDGVERTGDTRELAWKSGYRKGKAERKLHELPDEVPVLYDPADPSKSALEPPGRGDTWFWGAFGVALIAIGLYFFVS